MASNNVTIEVDLITRQAQANAEALSGSVLGLASKLSIITDAVDLASKAFDVVVGAIKPFADAALEATKSAIAFEASLAAIETIAAGADIGKLRKDLLDLSSAFGFDELSTAKAQYDLLSAGITDAADAALVLKNSAVLATAGVDTLESASKTVATSINAFGLAASDSAHITDVLAKTTQFGVLTLNELGGAFGNVAPVAAGAGLSIEETSAAIAAYTLSGKGAAEASTGLKALLVSLLKPSDDLQKAFTKATGASVAQSLANKGLSATLAEVNKIAGGTSEGWIKFTGGADAASAGLTLAVAKGKEFNAFTADMSDSTKKAGEAVQSMANIIEKTADFQLKSMVQTLENVGTELASVFEPAIAAAAQIITEFAVEFRDFIRENEAGLREVGKAAVQMVKDFGEFAKAIVNSQEFKTAISVLKDVALTSFTEMESAIKRVSAFYTEVFGGMNKDTQALQTVIKLFGEAIKLYLGNVIRDFENIAKAAILFGDSLNKAFGIVQGAGTTLLGLQSKLFGTGDAASFAAQKIDAFEESQSKIKPPDFGWVKNNVAALNTREAALKRGQSLDEAAAGQAVKLTDAQKKAAQELANFVNDQESTQYANKEERLVDYERSWNAHSMGITSVAQQTYAELRKYDEEYAKQKAKDLEDEVKRLESSQEDAVKAARDELDRQQKFLQEGLAYQEQYAQEQKKFWMDLASTIVSSLSSSVSAWTAIAEEENKAVAESAKAAAAAELEAFQALSDAKIDILKDESDKRIDAIKNADTESTERYKEESDARLQVALENINTAKEAEIEAIQGASNEKLKALQKEREAAKGEVETNIDDLLYPIEVKKEEELIRLKEVQREELKNSKDMTVEAIANIKVRQREEIRAIENKYAPEIEAIKVRADAEKSAIDETFDKKKEAIDKENKAAKDAIDERYKAQIDMAKKAEDMSFKTYKEGIAKRQQLQIDAIEEAFKKEKEATEKIIALKKSGLDSDRKSESLTNKKLAAASKTTSDIGAVLEKIPGPIGEIGSTIAGLTALVFQLPEIISGLPAMIEGFITAIPTAIAEILKAIPLLIFGIIDRIPDIVKGIVDSLPEIVKSLSYLLTSPEFYIKIITSLFDAVLEIVDFGAWGAAVWDGLKDAFATAGQWLAEVGTKIWEGLTAAFYALGDWLAEVGTKIWEGLKAAFELTFEWLWQIGTKIWEGLQYAFEAVFDWLYEVGATIWQGVKDAFGAVWGWLVAAGELIWEGVSAGFRKAGDWLASAGKSIWDGFVSAASAVWEWIKSIGRAIWDGLSEGLSSIGSFITGSESSTGIPIVGPIIDEVGSWFGFANGGMVPGARSSNDSILNDTVPALLSPGELVVPRSVIAGGMGEILAFAADAIGTRGPRRMNFASGGMVGATTSSFSRGNNSDVVDRLVSLEAKFDQLGYAIARNTMKTAQVLEQWNFDGLPETRTI